MCEKTESKHSVRRNEVACHPDNQVGQRLAGRQRAHGAIEYRRRRDRRADHAFDFPLASELLAPALVVSLQPSLEDRIGGQLRAAQGGVDPLAGERVEEVGGVSDQQGAGMPRGARVRRKWADRARFTVVRRIAEARRELRLGPEPFVQESGGIAHGARAIGERPPPPS